MRMVLSLSARNMVSLTVDGSGPPFSHTGTSMKSRAIRVSTAEPNTDSSEAVAWYDELSGGAEIQRETAERCDCESIRIKSTADPRLTLRHSASKPLCPIESEARDIFDL